MFFFKKIIRGLLYNPLLPLRENEGGCNLVSHFPFLIVTHTHTHSYTLVQLLDRVPQLGPRSTSFILTCVSVLCQSKKHSASPVFSFSNRKPD